MNIRFGIALFGALAGMAEGAAAPDRVFGFDSLASPTGLTSSGAVSIDADLTRSGTGALRIGPGGKAVLKLRDRNGSGRVEMWVHEDGAASPSPKKRAAGAMWGLVQADGLLLTVGAIYAPYLNGAATYAAAAFRPDANQRPWQKVQYLAVKRRPGWHAWTFDFDPDKGLRILYDGKDVNARRKVFLWDKTGFEGFVGVAFIGDAAGSGQVLRVDDLTAELGPPATVKPVWPPPPPPPPSSLTPPAPARPWVTRPYAAWRRGPGHSEAWFPIAVWLQDPRNAGKYKALGFNLFIGLWKGPTEKQLAALRKADMPVICAQNECALRHLDDPVIVGWMHGDEPDNAQRFETFWKNDSERIARAWPEYAGRTWRGYGPPQAPSQIAADYEEIRRRDPSRPVLLNLGQGVAWDNWRGRGVRNRHPEDYPGYIGGCDVVSFDIYPVVHSSLEVAGALWRVPFGVTRLRKWSRDRKIVWNCIECTRISNPTVKPTPHQVRAEVWMSLVFGSRGLIYFVHQFKPRFIEAALLADPEMSAAVGRINRQILALAPVLNSPTIEGGVRIDSSNPKAPIRFMVKEHGGARYVFAVNMSPQVTTGAVRTAGLSDGARVEVLGEDRRVKVAEGRFPDSFQGYDVHLYRIPLAGADPTP